MVDEVREDGARGKLDRAAGTVVDQQREGDALEQFAGRRPRHAAIKHILGSGARLAGGPARAGEGLLEVVYVDVGVEAVQPAAVDGAARGRR